MKRFWNWIPPETTNPDTQEDVRVLRINGAIAEESWLDDDVTPAVFESELNAGSGPVTVWLNSPGGDVVAAARIYAMAASHVAMSPVSMLMIHNPATLAMGDKTELSRALDMLESVKDSIINAYQLKTGLSRAKLSKLMDAETWMDATAAIELGFADELLTGKRAPTPDKEDEESEEPGEDEPPKNKGGVVFSRKVTEQRLVAQLAMHGKSAAPPGPPPPVSEHPCLKPAVSCGRRVVDLYALLTNQPH